MKKVLVIVLALVMVMSLVACAPAPQQPTSAASQQPTTAPAASAAATQPAKKLTFAFIIPSLDANWYKEITDSFKYGAEAIGADVIVLPSDNNVDKEVSNIDYCVANKVDGLCMFSFNQTGAVLAAKKMQDANIPCVVADSCGQALGKGADMVACVDFDWVKMGVTYADWMAQNTTGDFEIITGTFEHYPCIFVNQGMKDESTKLGKNKLLQTLATGYNPDNAAKVAETLISGGDKFTTIFVMMEEMAASVCRVLKDKGVLNNPYKVISQNGQPMGVDLVKSGDMAMTIGSSPGWEGYVCFRIIYSQIMGKINYKNKQIMMPTTVIDQAAAIKNDPNVIIPWHRDPIFMDLTTKNFPDLMWN
jgi:ribose transport system substrate-binding protein